MNRITRILLLASAAVYALPLLAGDDTPALELRPCANAELATFRCGTLQVPENREVPGGRLIALNVLVMPARDGASRQAPLFSLDGGPGMAATDGVGFFATEGRVHWQDRDVVLVDQRGTGRSAPLRCPALEARHRLQRMYSLDEVRACRDALAPEHDLTQYTTIAAARDLEAVRDSLGYDTIDLMGLSYGTRLAQTYARLYPQRVRGMVLLGTVPMDRRLPLDHAANGQAVLDAVFAGCDADAACHAAYPELRQEWAGILAQLERSPMQVSFVRDGRAERIEISRGPFGEAFRSLLLATPGQRNVPYLIHQMASGNFQPFLEPLLATGAPGIAEGLYLSVTCGEDTGRIESSEIAASAEGTFLGRYRVDEQVAACREWPSSRLPTEQFGAVRLDVPVLLLAGTMDYVTPLAWAEGVAGALPNSRVVPIPHLGHFPFGLSAMDCYDKLITEFFQAGDATSLDVACVGQMAPPPFVVHADLVVTNARIIDGTGQTIEKGSIVVADGRIASVSEGPVDAGDSTVIDAQGMTVLPGLIDVHRHDLLGSLQGFAKLGNDAEVAEAVEQKAPASMRALLAEGFTTVMMPGMFLSAGRDVRGRIERGEIAGPRVLTSGPGFTALDDFPARGMVCGDNVYCSEHVAYQVTDSEVARGHVRTLAEGGVDAIKVFVDAEGNDLEDKVFAAIAEEAEVQGLPVYLHAHRVEDMLEGVHLGANRLVHTPSDALIADGPGARLLRQHDVAIATAASYTAPAFAEAFGFPYSAGERRERLLQNVRHLMDEGVVVAFGTDSPDLIRPMVEIEELSRVLSPGEVIATLTRNAALFLGREDEIGTLEPGKAADLVIVDGNPLVDIHDLARVQVVIQEGVVTVDNRQ